MSIQQFYSGARCSGSRASMSVDTHIAIASLAFNVVAAAATIYIAYLALVHTAKPRITVSLHEEVRQPCSKLLALHYDLRNRGHWYALPPAIDVVVFCDFDPRFDLIGIGYGSQQETLAAEVRIGKAGRKFLKAKGLKLIANDLGEVIQVHVRTPAEPGMYLTRISAYSPNGLSHFQDFPLECYRADMQFGNDHSAA